MRILLVEDNPVDAQALVDCLDEGAPGAIELSQVTCLAELDKHLGALPDVVLLDLSLPDGSGADSVRHARAKLGDVPLVVMTSDDDHQRSIEVLREGAEDYLVKGSYNADSLLRALRYARERHDLKHRLAHADRLAVVGQLAAGVAHEVSNPAALALANTSIIEDLLKTLASPMARGTGEGINPDFAIAECRRMVGENRAALERIRAVVRDLQGYSRLGRNEVERVSLSELVDRSCGLVESSIRHSATLVRRLKEVPLIAADAGKLEQMLTNLLINAGHALEGSDRGPGKIIVSTEVAGAGIRLSVEDNGCGMPEDVRARVFEPFFTTKTADRGTGLGMAIVADIVRQHGGRIECWSEVGRGTRFDVFIPLQTGFSLPPPTPEQDTNTSGLRGRVLLIDDEALIADVYGDIIGERHDVVVAHGGRAGDAVLDADGDFDVVVCDLMMPEMDGVALFEKAVERAPKLRDRFIFCSGGLVTQRARDFARDMTNPLLYKPTSNEALLDAIDRVLREHTPASAKASA